MQSELRDKISCNVWQFVTNMNSWISITHLAGVDNIDADAASCILNEKNWVWTWPKGVHTAM